MKHALRRRLNTIYVDVDGTLLYWPGRSRGRVPRPGEQGHGQPPQVNRTLVERLKASKAKIVIWTRGGQAHAEMAAKLCGLENAVCLAKPDLFIDDSAKWFDQSHPKSTRLIGPEDAWFAPR